MEKNFKFIPNSRITAFAFNLSFALLPAKIDFVIEKQRCKKNAIKAYDTGCIEMILALPTKVIILYI